MAVSRQEKNQEKQEQLLEEERRQRRKKLVILGIKITILVVILVSGIYLYTKYCATKGLIVKEERIVSEKLPESFNSFKIIQFSDLHYGTTVLEEEVTSLVNTINKRKPDLIVFTGDLIDKDYKIKNDEQEQLIKILKKLDASIGKYAISGEDDKDSFQIIMNQSDFTILNNDYDLVYATDNEPILLIGLSSLNNDTRDIKNAYRYFNEETHNSNIYTITLMHETDSIDEINTNYSTDLILAGHSHNGQINIPGLGPLIKKEGSKKYDDAFYKVNNTSIYVSSGIGSDELGFRIFARPSINFFRLSK